MKRIWGFAAATALAAVGLPAAPALADQRSDYAKSACKDRVSRDYGASSHNVKHSESGYDRYNVTGEARRDGQAASFSCRTDRGSVQSLNVGSWNKKSGGGGDAVAAVGIAVGLAAIIAAASSKKKNNDQYDRYGQQSYYQNNNGYNGYYNNNNNNNYNNNNSYNYNDSFSPGKGIVCYRAQRACFDNNNNYNPRWSQREFSY